MRDELDSFVAEKQSSRPDTASLPSSSSSLSSSPASSSYFSSSAVNGTSSSTVARSIISPTVPSSSNGSATAAQLAWWQAHASHLQQHVQLLQRRVQELSKPIQANTDRLLAGIGNGLTAPSTLDGFDLAPLGDESYGSAPILGLSSSSAAVSSSSLAASLDVLRLLNDHELALLRTMNKELEDANAQVCHCFHMVACFFIPRFDVFC